MVAIVEPSRPTRRVHAQPCVGSGACARDKTPDPGTDRNQQYSITALTDGGGSIVERYAYTAYGQVTFADASGTVQAASPSDNRYTYTGREWDDGLSLYHYRARMYDAVAGRFVSRDPIGYAIGPNLFAAYFKLSETDPSGWRPCTRMEQASLLPKCPSLCSKGDATYTGGLYTCEVIIFGRLTVYDCNCITSKGCKTSYLRPLHTQMHQICDNIGKCSGTTVGFAFRECASYRTKEVAWLRCAKRREFIQQKCFSPTDSQWNNHIIAINQAINASKSCGSMCRECFTKYYINHPF